MYSWFQTSKHTNRPKNRKILQIHVYTMAFWFTWLALMHEQKSCSSRSRTHLFIICAQYRVCVHMYQCNVSHSVYLFQSLYFVHSCHSDFSFICMYAQLFPYKFLQKRTAKEEMNNKKKIYSMSIYVLLLALYVDIYRAYWVFILFFFSSKATKNSKLLL